MITRCWSRCSAVNTLKSFAASWRIAGGRATCLSHGDYDKRRIPAPASGWRNHDSDVQHALCDAVRPNKKICALMARYPSSLAVLIATLTVQSLAAMCLLTLPVVAPAVARTLGISPAYVGLYIALAYLAAMTSSLIAGGAVRRFGAIRASQAGLVLCAGGIALCAVASPVATGLGALLVGLG